MTDLQKVARFYKEALRFTQTDFGDLGATQLVFLSRDPAEHHQIVLATGRPADMAFNVVNQISDAPGSKLLSQADRSLRVDVVA